MRSRSVGCGRIRSDHVASGWFGTFSKECNVTIINYVTKNNLL
jgi:hypothetical protein